MAATLKNEKDETFNECMQNPVGAVFIFSGFVKGVDPLGSNYKFIDYFNAFGMGWMNFSALFFSFVLSLAEFLIGICLFLNIKTQWAAWGALLFMAVFHRK